MRTPMAHVEDVSEDDEDFGPFTLGRDEAEHEPEYEYEWGTEDYDHDKYTAISVWDELSEIFLLQAQLSGVSSCAMYVQAQSELYFVP